MVPEVADFGISDQGTAPAPGDAPEPDGLSLRALNGEITVLEIEIGMMCAAGLAAPALARSGIDAAEQEIVDAEEVARILLNWAATGERS